MDQISTPWATSSPLTIVIATRSSRGHTIEGAEGPDMPGEKEVDTVVEMRSSTHVGPFQTENLDGKIAQAPTHDTHVMVTPIGCADLKWDGGCQLPPGIQVLHVYTTLMAGCKQISIVVRNVTDQAIFLKKGVQVAHVVSVNLVPQEEVPSKQEEDTQTMKERMTV